MHPKIPQWTEDLNAITDAVKSEFGQLSTEELNWKPLPEKWSIAQVLDHLITINRTYFPILESVKAGTFKRPFLGRFPFVYNFFGKFILKGSQPTNQKKTKTFPMWEPAQSTISKDIVERFAQHQQILIDEIKNCDQLLADGPVIHSPVNRNIPYKLEQAFDIIVAHEKRHLNQAREVLKALQSQNSVPS